MKGLHKHQVEVLVLFLVLMVHWPGPPLLKPCSRDLSALVRRVIAKRWIPILERYGLEFPLECPFHPDRDVFQEQELARRMIEPNHWSCGLCGKSFVSETFLNVHMDLRHSSALQETEDAVCFADFCDVMRCEVLRVLEAYAPSTPSVGVSRSTMRTVTALELWQDSSAFRTAVALSAPRELALPLPPAFACGAAGYITSSNSLKGHWPQCKMAEERPKKGETNNCWKSPILDNTTGHCGYVNVTLVNKTNEAGQKADAEERAKLLEKQQEVCDEDKMTLMRLKCEILVRDCIFGLLLNLTGPEFLDVEAEMHRTICSFLSCDKYWEDALGQNERRSPTWALCALLLTGVVLALAVAIAYYVACVCFADHEEGSKSSVSTPHSSVASWSDNTTEEDSQYSFKFMRNLKQIGTPGKDKVFPVVTENYDGLRMVARGRGSPAHPRYFNVLDQTDHDRQTLL